MTKLAVSPARTKNEVQLALELALSVFEASSGMDDYARYKAFLWHEDPTFEPGNILLGRIGSGSPIGLVRIVPRRLYRANQPFSVAGISSVCLSSDQRGKGHSVALMEQALAHCSERQFDLAFLFARRAIDYYYTRFGFWGVASYSRLKIQLPRETADPDLALGDADEQHIDLYGGAYDRCYANTFGRVSRSADYWRFLLRRMRYFPDHRFSTLFVQGIPVGYVLWSDSVIRELAYVEGPRAGSLLSLLGKSLPDARLAGCVTLELSPQHVLVAESYGLDVTLSARECTYGGHMALVLNPAAMLDRMFERTPVVAKELMHLANMKQLSHRETCRLLGAWSPSASRTDGEQLLPLNIGFADQF